MIKLLLIAGAATLAVPAIASETRGLDFVRDGHHFVGTIEDGAHGQYVTGRDVTSGEIFSLVVANGKVSGTFGGQEVDFDATGLTETASR